MEDASLPTPPAISTALLSESMPTTITYRDQPVNTYCVRNISRNVKNGGMTFSANLRRIRLSKGMTQEALAEACGWSGQSRIANYESSLPKAREPKVSEVPLLVKALGTTVAELFGEQTSQPQRLDSEKLADLLETVEAAIIQSRRQIPARTKARIVAALYADEQASAAASPQAVQTALSSILSSLSLEET